MAGGQAPRRLRARRRWILWPTIAAFFAFTVVVMIIEDVHPSLPWNETVTAPTPTPTPTPEPTPTPTPEPTPSPTQTPKFDPVPTVTPPAATPSISGITTTDIPAGIGDVKGLLEIVLDEEDAHEAISVPQTIRFPDLQEAALSFVETQRAALAQEAPAGNGTLKVAYTPTIAHGQILGIAQQGTRTSPRALYGVTHTQSLYLDVLRGDVYLASDLLTDAAKAQLEESIYAALVEAGILDVHLGQDDGDLFADVRLSDDGQMVIVIGQGILAPRQAGLVAVQIPAEEVPELLSDGGKTVYKGLVTDAQFLGLQTDERPDCAELKCVALTFDDGPNKHTPIVLNALADKQAPATFFLLGQQVKQNPELVQRIFDEGHDIGGHSWNHPDLTKLEPEDLETQMKRTRNEIRNVTGYDHLWERPPYGAVNDDVLKTYADLGYTAVLWSVDPEDWRDRDSKIVKKRVVEQARQNSIILLHDIHPTTGEAVAEIIDGLRAEGYTLVRLSDVVESQPGTVIEKLNG